MPRAIARMQHDKTHVAFVPGEARAITIKYIEEQLTNLKRRDVLAGGMMCCEGHRIVPVICKFRQSHFRHVKLHKNGGTTTNNVSACSCSKSKVHLEAQKLLNDHDYSEPVRFVQWYSCGIHHSTVFEATTDVYPVLEVTERSRDDSRRFRTDIVYRNRTDDEICQRVEIWHRHRTKIDGARRDIEFLEADATHVKQNMLLKDFTIRVEVIHAKECPICAEVKRRAGEERENRRRKEFERQVKEEEKRLAAERFAEEELRREVAEEEKRLAAERFAEEKLRQEVAEAWEARKRLAAERFATEEKRLAAERFAEEKLRREVEEAKKRLAAERFAKEEKRLTAERLAEEERLKEAAELDESRRQHIETHRQQHLLAAKQSAVKRKEQKCKIEEANIVKAQRTADDAMTRHRRDYQEAHFENIDEIQGRRMLRWRDELITLHNKKLKYKYKMRLAKITELCPTFVECFWNNILVQIS